MRLSDNIVHFIFYSILCHLISEALIAISKVDDAAIGEAVLLDVVLHDTIIFMSIDSDVCIMRETEQHPQLHSHHAFPYR